MYASTPYQQKAPTMHGKICVVTGATSGIGRATALGLAQLGAKIVIVARNPKKAAAVVAEIAGMAGTLQAEYVIADLTEMHEVARAAGEIASRFGKVDVLINNTGGMFDTYHQSSEGIEDAYAVNHLAGFLLTLSLCPSFRLAGHARVVMVGSNVQSVPYVADYASLVRPSYQWSKVYAQTKLRTLVFAQALSARWAKEGITVNSLHPGVVDTGLVSGWENPVMRNVFGVVKAFFISPEAGARTSIFLASDLTIADITGTFFAKRRPRTHNAAANDPAVQEQLWLESLSSLRQAGIAVPAA